MIDLLYNRSSAIHQKVIRFLWHNAKQGKNIRESGNQVWTETTDIERKTQTTDRERDTDNRHRERQTTDIERETQTTDIERETQTTYIERERHRQQT